MDINDLSEEKKDNTPASSSDSIGEIAATQPEVLTGYQLYLLIFSLSLAGFIYSLDVTIIVTVSSDILLQLGSLFQLLTFQTGYPRHHNSFPHHSRHWLVRECIPHYIVSFRTGDFSSCGQLPMSNIFLDALAPLSLASSINITIQR